MYRQPFVLRKILAIHLYYRLSPHQAHTAAVRFRSTKKGSDLVMNRTRNLLPCGLVTCCSEIW
jgi:hypothetical protein